MKATRSPRCAATTSSRSTVGTQLDVHGGRRPVIQADGAPSALKVARKPGNPAVAGVCQRLRPWTANFGHGRSAGNGHAPSKTRLTLARGRTPVDPARLEVRARQDRAQAGTVRTDQAQRVLPVILEAEHDPVAVRRVAANIAANLGIAVVGDMEWLAAGRRHGYDIGRLLGDVGVVAGRHAATIRRP